MDCLFCWSENGATLGCEASYQTCMCDWCQEMRWLDAHPLEAAELEFEKADQAAQDAEERGWEDAPALAAEARAAFRHWQQLAEAGQGPEGAERSDANP